MYFIHRRSRFAIRVRKDTKTTVLHKIATPRTSDNITHREQQIIGYYCTKTLSARLSDRLKNRKLKVLKQTAPANPSTSSERSIAATIQKTKPVGLLTLFLFERCELLVQDVELRLLPWRIAPS
ncbi:hypothetical protein Droror1_Dr00006912 [Drosera rotundifolia]